MRNSAWRDRLALLIASGGGVGYVPWAPGTFGSLWGIVFLVVSGGSWRWMALLTLMGWAAALWAIPRVEEHYQRKDPPVVVIDECVGMCLSLVGWPLHGLTVGAALVLFRVFDIWKPFPIRRIHARPGAWSVILDDAMAAVYVQLCLRGYFLVFSK